MILYYQIEVGCECLGIVVKDGKVIEASKSLKWTIGKGAKFVLDYYRKMKGAKITIVDE